MADTTSTTDEVTRDEAADLLQEVARELRGEGPADVHVGNKTLRLLPASIVEYGIEVEERSPMLGGDREEITLSLGWEVENAED
ncbi:amphi-Trp domain-containing protein [Halosolutus gelatinilyticus]|uniref:amphi-Trp domain-containing protein n=1 Tax=Halosolutus gelatinilyticus TaxID=2931975 RepID=UPI001FF3E887|nr:amphi-Trp domain-containing protein [Halosolutus gelatinilyticus]